MSQLVYDRLTNNIPEVHRLVSEIHACQSCPLYQSCTRKVPGSGPIPADIMFVGEAPGEMEDLQGIPFVGPAGQLMNRAIEAVGWKREEIYITNVIKCRPPKNRTPQVEEIAKCHRFILREIELVKPKVLICWGSTAAKTLIHPDFKMAEDHGKRFSSPDGYEMFGVYHPAYLLRLEQYDPQKAIEAKWKVFNVLQEAKKIL